MATTRGFVLLIPVLLAGCGSDHFGAGAGYSADGGASARACFGANDCRPGDYCNPFGFCVPIQMSGATADMGSPLPPEVHTRVDPPASGLRYVYVAVPSRNNVVKIDSVDLSVRTIPVGDDPGPLRTIAGADVAVVLNKQSNNATILRSKNDGSDDLVTLATAPGLNQLSMGPGGHYALAWFDLIASGGVLSPKQTFQEVTLLALDPGKEKAIDLAVGFRPEEVQFAPDGSAAWIITETGISIVPLLQQPKPGIVQTVPLVRDAFKEPPPDLVVVTSNGARALARQTGLDGIRSVDLKTGDITDVSLGGIPTDIEITPKSDLAVVVLRDQKQVAFVPLPAGIVDPTKIVKASLGTFVAGQASIAADGTRAVLFSNATDEKLIILADLGALTVKPLPLKKGVRNVLLAPDGKSAIVIHNKAPGTPNGNDTLDQYLDKLQGYSLLNLQTGYAKLQPADAAPGPVAFAPDGASGYVLLRDDNAGVRSVDVLDLVTFLVTSVRCGSPPVAVGAVPMGKQIFVAQDHPLGRITFIDSTTFKTRTLTGFALNGGIIE